MSYDRGDVERATCVHCGGRCGRWTAPRERVHSRHCADCRSAIETVRRTLVEGMWAAGWPWREIYTTVGGANGALSVWRARGWDLPYRYAMRDGKRVAA